MKGVDVNLPTGVSGQTWALSDYVSVSVDKHGHYFFDKDEVADEELMNHLRKVHDSAPDAKVFVRGDRDSVHLNVTHALDIIRSAGFYKISFEIRSKALKGVSGKAEVDAITERQRREAEATTREPKGTETMAVKGISVNLPVVGLPPSGVKDFVSIIVLEGNAVFFDNQYVADDEVLPRLFQLHRANRDIKISISARPMAIYGDVIGVLDKARSVGITKVGYQIRAASGPQDLNIENFAKSDSQSVPTAIYTPKPAYPAEWAKKGFTGRGVVLVTIDEITGKVIKARMLQSTGNKQLDDSALEAYSQWRFDPRTVSVSQLKIPIEFGKR